MAAAYLALVSLPAREVNYSANTGSWMEREERTEIGDAFYTCHLAIKDGETVYPLRNIKRRLLLLYEIQRER